MTSDIKAEAQAVRNVRAAVISYAEDLRETMRSASKEAALLLSQSQAVLDGRRGVLRRAEQELAQALEAARRDEGGGAARRVAAAQKAVDAARREVERSQRAVLSATSVQRDLSAVFATAEANVGKHGSTASSILAALEDRLHEYSAQRLASTARSALSTLHIAAEISLASVGAAKSIGPIAGATVPDVNGSATSSQRADSSVAEAQNLWRENEEMRKERGE